MTHPKPIEPGTPIRFKRDPYSGWDGTATVISEIGAFEVLTPTGYMRTVERSQFTVMRNGGVMVPSQRERLPYGVWTCADGREVLFNRNYQPIWERIPGDLRATRADHDERVRFTTQRWFFDDTCPPWATAATKRRCEALLENFAAGEPIPNEDGAQ